MIDLYRGLERGDEGLIVHAYETWGFRGLSKDVIEKIRAFVRSFPKTLDEMDAVVSFFLHRARRLTLMHCVAEYPTPGDQLRLAQIDVLRERYPGVRIGYSTHEDPAATTPVRRRNMCPRRCTIR